MIGLGGWGDRNEKSGPYLRLREGAWKPDPTPGRGGSHGKQHDFLMITRAPEHPIMRGLPTKWMHAKDELYDRLRGPAKDLIILASAYSAKEQNGSGEDEPLLMARTYGKGRVFHTALGHNNGPDLTAQNCVGFIVTLQRGTEWAASGKVTQKIPEDFPDDKAVKSR
jgi:type 1 glutamine amidotransferase